MQTNPLDSEVVASDQHADTWREQGPWLILLLLPLMALAFRRGVLLILPLLLLPFPPQADALGWDELWQNHNQRGSLLFEQGDHDAAANLFNHPQWKASSLYRAGKYDEALQFWNSDDSEDSQYNRGNALAKVGRYEDAIKAYQQVLDQNPQHLDASYNKQLLEDILKQQQQQQQDQQQQNQTDNNSQESNDSNQDANTGEDQQQAQSDPDTSQADQQGEQNSATQESQGEQQDGTETQASQAEQAPSNEETSGEAEAEVEVDDQMSEQAANQWLRKIPDDPGGLLRRKFIYQHKNRPKTAAELNQW